MQNFYGMGPFGFWPYAPPPFFGAPPMGAVGMQPLPHLPLWSDPNLMSLHAQLAAAMQSPITALAYLPALRSLVELLRGYVNTTQANVEALEQAESSGPTGVGVIGEPNQSVVAAQLRVMRFHLSAMKAYLVFAEDILTQLEDEAEKQLRVRPNKVQKFTPRNQE